MTEIIAYHGWGFDAEVWRYWEDTFESEKIAFRSANRGYFSDPVQAAFKDSNSFKILLCHSFGIHWIPEDQLTSADALILINSFIRLPDPSVLGETKAVQISNSIRAMERKLSTQPDELLDDFRHLCDYKSKDHKWEIADKQLLKEDLIKMRTEPSLQPEHLKINKLILIEAEKDLVVPGSRIGNFENCSHNTIHHIVKDSGHALPFTHRDSCISLIKEGIPILSDYESGKYYSGK